MLASLYSRNMEIFVITITNSSVLLDCIFIVTNKAEIT